MTKGKKLIIAVIVLLVILPVLRILIAIFPLFKNSISLKMKSTFELPKAEQRAIEYIEKKYGETPEILSSEPLSVGVSWTLFERAIYAYQINMDGYSVIVDDETVVDDRQYEAICAAVTDKYLDDKNLGSSFTVNYFTIGFPGEIIRHGKCTSVYFDGDIEKFIAETSPVVRVSVTYEGYPEKRSEYRQIIDDKFAEINSAIESATMSIFIHDPTLDLPEMPYKLTDGGTVWSAPQYEKYMELIACGISERDNITIYQTDFKDIDEYTAISDDSRNTSLMHGVSFTPVDLSDNTTAYRGQSAYRESSESEENILTIRNEGWYIGFSDHHKNILLRLDREHYGITDNTIPLFVSDMEDPKTQKIRRYYVTVGFDNGVIEDIDTTGWYYLDDDYLYLWINSFQYDFPRSKWYLTFTDIS